MLIIISGDNLLQDGWFVAARTASRLLSATLVVTVLSITMLFSAGPLLAAESSFSKEDYFRQGIEDMNQGDWSLARDKFIQLKDALKGTDLEDDLNYHLGWALIRCGDSTDGMYIFDTFPERFPDSPYISHACYALGTMLVQEGRRDEAEERFKLCLELDGTKQVTPSALFGLGKLAEMKRNIHEAISRHSAIVTEFPDSNMAAAAHFELGALSCRTGEIKSAYHHLETAVSLRPGFRAEAGKDPRFRPLRRTAAGKQLQGMGHYGSPLYGEVSELIDLPEITEYVPRGRRYRTPVLRAATWEFTGSVTLGEANYLEERSVGGVTRSQDVRSTWQEFGLKTRYSPWDNIELGWTIPYREITESSPTVVFAANDVRERKYRSSGVGDARFHVGWQTVSSEEPLRAHAVFLSTKLKTGHTYPLGDLHPPLGSGQVDIGLKYCHKSIREHYSYTLGALLLKRLPDSRTTTGGEDESFGYGDELHLEMTWEWPFSRQTELAATVAAGFSGDSKGTNPLRLPGRRHYLSVIPEMSVMYGVNTEAYVRVDVPIQQVEHDVAASFGIRYRR